MQWTGSWYGTPQSDEFRGLNMVAWVGLSPVDLVGSLAGLRADNSQIMCRFYLKLDGAGSIKHLVLENTELISGRTVAFDKLDPRILDAAKQGAEAILSMHDVDVWANQKVLSLRSGMGALLEASGEFVLSGGEPTNQTTEKLIQAAQLLTAAPVKPASENGEVCPACHAKLIPTAKFCGECGTKIDAGHATQQARSSHLVTLHPVELGLPIVDLVVQGAEFEGPNEDGGYQGHATVCLENATAERWDWGEVYCVLFNGAGQPVEVRSTDFVDLDAQSQEILNIDFWEMNEGRLCGAFENTQIAAACTAYQKSEHSVGQARLGKLDDVVHLGRQHFSGVLSVVDFSLLAREFDGEGDDADELIELTASCLVQNISPRPVVRVVAELRLIGPDEDTSDSRSNSSVIKPGEFELIDFVMCVNKNAFDGMKALASVSLFTPIAFGCGQAQGATVTSLESAPDDSDEDLQDIFSDVDDEDTDTGDSLSEDEGDVCIDDEDVETETPWANFVAAVCDFIASKEEEKPWRDLRNRIHRFPNIPDDLLTNALKHFPDVSPEQVQLLIDDTIKLSASDCFLMTDDGFHAKTMGSKPMSLAFSDIASVEYKALLMGITPCLRINGEDFFSSAQLPKPIVKELAEQLNVLLQQHRPESE